MIELIYHSAPAHSLQISELYKLLEQARSFNAQHGITGVLMFNNSYFLQALEGDAHVVRALAQRIRADTRHQHFTLLGEQTITERTWTNWSMGLIMPNQRAKEVIATYCPGEFQPHILQLHTAHSLLQDLTQVATETA